MRDSYEYGDRIDRVVLFHARRNPTDIAVQQDGHALTYGQLVQRAAAFATRLKEAGVAPGSFVPTSMARSTELVVALLGIVMAGAAYIPMDPAWPLERTESIARRSGAPFVISDGEPGNCGESRRLPFRTLLADDAKIPPLDAVAEPVGSGADAANMLFTSGSTGQPKGVITPHRGTVRALVNVPVLPLDRSTTFLQAASLPWDGFAVELWGALLNGGQCVLLDRGRTTVDTAVLHRRISDGVNSLLLTPALFGVIAEEDPAVFARVRLVVVGGERVSPAHIRPVLRRFPALPIVNVYGPAEASVIATAHSIRLEDVADEAVDVPIGTALPKTRVEVLTEGGRPVRTGELGEIVIAGDGLALGYLDDPAETTRRFFQASGPRPAPGTYYRTGDLAVVDADGTLRYRGRVDRQFKVRGVRIEPGEVESVLEAHPCITACCAVRIEPAPQRAEVACAYTTSDGRPLADAEVRDFAARRLPPAIVPSAFVHLPRLPLGATGKVDSAAVAAHLHRYRVPSGDSEPDGSAADALMGEVREMLGLRSLTPRQDVIDAGISSLDVIRLAARLSARLGKDVSVADVYSLRTVDKVRAAAADRTLGTSAPPVLTGGDAPATGPLSHAQRRFLFAEAMAPGAADNLVVTAYQLRGPLDLRVLRQALRDVVVRHPILRTVYPRRNGVLEQRIIAPEEVIVSLEETAAPQGHALMSPRHIAEHVTGDWWAATPFALDRDIPIRARMCTLGQDHHLLMLCIHHIAFDGWSEALFCRDLAAAYDARLRGRPPAATAGPSYLRYALWESSRLDHWREADLPFWQQNLSPPAEAFLPAPTTKGEAPRQELSQHLDADTVARLAALAGGCGGPPVAVLLGAVALAMHRVFGVADPCLGTVTAGRFETALHDLVGYFVNPVAVPLRSVRSDQPLATMRASAAGLVSGLRHSRTPFDELVRELKPDRARHPWFQAWVIHQKQQPRTVLEQHTTLAPVRVSPPRTAAEWMLQAFPDDLGGWELVTHWRTDATDAATATTVADELFSVLRSSVR
ncbi:amino acid adenylation domain-containing protein [Streptomyces sp. NPDC006265]|uniref:amino acid adenylation domain-containing protein n=1 Tax=Streptomyces sp. NPDC006265 TaxID=3156740 RepID=UPI0033A0D3EF